MQREPDRALARRRRTAVDQRQQFAQLPQPSRPRVPLRQLRHLVQVETLTPHQRIQPGQRLGALQVTPQIERRAHPRGHGQAADAGDLVGGHALGSQQQALLRRGFDAGHVDGAPRVHPGRPVQCGRGHPGDDPLPTCGQPGPDRTVLQRDLPAVADEHAAVELRVVAAELMPGRHACPDGFAAEDDPVHAVIVPTATDTSGLATGAQAIALRPSRDGRRGHGPASARRRTPDPRPSAARRRCASPTVRGCRAASAPDTSRSPHPRCWGRSR